MRRRDLARVVPSPAATASQACLPRQDGSDSRVDLSRRFGFSFAIWTVLRETRRWALVMCCVSVKAPSCVSSRSTTALWNCSKACATTMRRPPVIQNSIGLARLPTLSLGPGRFPLGDDAFPLGGVGVEADDAVGLEGVADGCLDFCDGDAPVLALRSSGLLPDSDLEDVPVADAAADESGRVSRGVGA